jgi:hypothetical protein
MWSKRPRPCDGRLKGDEKEVKSMRFLTLICLLSFMSFLFPNVNEASAAIISHTDYLSSTGRYHVAGEVESTGSTPTCGGEVIGQIIANKPAFEKLLQALAEKMNSKLPPM